MSDHRQIMNKAAFTAILALTMSLVLCTACASVKEIPERGVSAAEDTTAGAVSDNRGGSGIEGKGQKGSERTAGEEILEKAGRTAAETAAEAVTGKNTTADEDEKEEVVEIDEKNGNGRDTATIKTNITEDKKKKIIKELKEQKEKIDKLKEAIPKLIGEEKYNYIMELCSIGVRDNSKQEEMNDKIEQFVKDNCVNGNEEKMCDIYQLFIFECQYYKKQEQLSKL